MTEHAAAVTAPPQDIPRRMPWGLGDMAKAIGLVILLTILFALPAAFLATLLAGRSSDLEDSPAALTVLLGISFFLEAFMLSCALYFSVRKYRLSLSALGLRLPRRGSWWLPLVLLGGGMAIMYVYFGVLAAFGVDPQSDLPDQVFHNVAPLTVLIVLSVLIAPIVEEIFFRGFIFGGLRGRWGTALAALGSGLLFGAAHLGNPGTFYIVPPIALVGVLFSLGYAYSGSILATIAAHFLFNLISVAVGIASS